MKRCKNCKSPFEPVNARNVYCDKCKKRGNRGMRFYHAKHGEGINVGIKASCLRKYSTQLKKEVLDGTEKT